MGVTVTFQVLMVCTANHCRSPMGQQLLQHAATGRFGEGGWQVDSAGTNIPGPWPLHQHAATVLRQRLGRVAPHRSTSLSTAVIGASDLILTASRRQRGIVVKAVPTAMGRTFTIRQFARLSDAVTAPPPGVGPDDPTEQGRWLVHEAKLARSSLQPVPGDEEDLPDPMGGPLADFELCADRLQDAIDRILRPLPAEHRSA
jgi:protein-tyrosine phosphatase